MKADRSRKLLRGLGVALATLVAAATLLLVVGYVMITYRPAAYRPRLLSKAQQEQTEQLGFKKTEELYNKVNMAEPFTIAFRQGWLNDLLMLAEQRQWVEKISPEASDQVRQLQVRLADNRIYLMGEVSLKGVSTVLTMGLDVWAAGPDRLDMKLTEVKAGALTVPTDVVARVLSGFCQRGCAIEANEKGPGEAKCGAGPKKAVARDLWARLGPLAQQLAQDQQVTVDNVFTATEDGKQGRITEVIIGGGQIEFGIEPLPIAN